MSKKVDYAKIVQELAQEDLQEIMVKVQGKEFPLKCPSKYAYWSLLMKSNDEKYDGVEMAVQTMNLFLPVELSNDLVFNLMNKDGFFKGEGELFQAFTKFNDYLNSDEAYEAGQDDQADRDF